MHIGVSSGETYHMRERRFGRFSRSITLPLGVDAEEVEADHERGILTINVPKADEVKPKRISVKAHSNGRKSIAGEAS
jgi:HSP20 family protein